MSSSEADRSRFRRGSDKKQKNTSAPRHFRDDKAPVKKAPVEPEKLVTEETLPDTPAGEETMPEEPVLPSDSEHHSHHSDSEHHSHHSHRSSPDVVSMWDDDFEGEQGWTDTAYINTKKAEVTDSEPEVVAPVEKEDRVKPEKLEVSVEPETSFDYVTPAQTYKQHLKNPGKSSTHTGKTKMASREEIEEAEEGFVFRSLSDGDKKKRRRHHHHHHHSSSGSSSSGSSSSGENTSGSDSSAESSSDSGKTKKRHRHHHHRLPRWAKIVIIVLCVLLAIVIALIGTYFILKEIGRKSMHTIEEHIEIVSPTNPQTGEEIIEVVDNGRTIVHEGKTYRINNDVVCVAVIGINYDYEDKTFQSMGDAINLVALDTETGKLSVIGISRDTMTDVKVYSEEGSYIDNEIMQLSYAYSFDSETVSGGENTASSLSKLFYGLPVDNYFAINLDALITLNDAIGGVTLTASTDFSSPVRDISAGETVTLHGREVEYYVRRRDNSVDGNNGRMKRQQEYIKAFLSQVIPAVKKDLSLVSDLYNIIRANSASNLDLPKIVYLASELTSKLGSTSDIDYLTIEGKTVAGEEHTEFYADDANVLETLINVFYQPE